MLTDVVNMSIKIQPPFLLDYTLMAIVNNIRTNADISIIVFTFIHNTRLFLQKGHKVAIN